MGETRLTIQQFILDEMERRDMSMRQFAELMGVAQSTVSRLLDGKQDKPTLDFLLRLSKATKVRLSTLVELAYPEAAEGVGPHPSTIVVAEMIENLPEGLREAVMTILRSRVN